jgi:hypothetical protein
MVVWTVILLKEGKGVLRLIMVTSEEEASITL